MTPPPAKTLPAMIFEVFREWGNYGYQNTPCRKARWGIRQGKHLIQPTVMIHFYVCARTAAPAKLRVVWTRTPTARRDATRVEYGIRDKGFKSRVHSGQCKALRAGLRRQNVLSSASQMLLWVNMSQCLLMFAHVCTEAQAVCMVGLNSRLEPSGCVKKCVLESVSLRR